MPSLAAECRLFMPKLTREQIVANQIQRQKEREKMALQNEVMLRATYGIGQFLMGIFGLKDIPRNALPFPTS